MPGERRRSATKRAKYRADFEHSTRLLRELGLPDWAVEYYRRVARRGGILPHQLIVRIAVATAIDRIPHLPDEAAE